MSQAQPLHEGRCRLSVGVLTKNEAHRIEACLRSAAFADEVVVIDSGSTDDTVAVARALGAQVHVYPDWQGFAVQRNRLLQHVTGEYVFFLDADEVITPELRLELEAVVRSAALGVWKIEWTIVAFGRELTYFQPQSRVERLFWRASLKEFEGVVHEQAVLDESLGKLPRHVFKGRLLHYSRETVRAGLEKLTQYALLGATKRAQWGKRGGVLRGMASASVVFLRLYVLRLGFTGGGAGFLYCWFIALEFFFRYAALYYDRDSLSATVARGN